MRTDHDDLKLKRRPEGFEIFFVRRMAPNIRVPGGRLEAGRRIMLKSTADELAGISARALSYNDRRLTVRTLGFARPTEAVHNGMIPGDIIWCDDSYVFICERA